MNVVQLARWQFGITTSACGSSGGIACRRGSHLATILAAAIGTTLSAWLLTRDRNPAERDRTALKGP